MIIIYNNWSANQYIRMISEGSCNTEDWNNDADAITEIHFILKYITIENSYFKPFPNFALFYCIFEQINAALIAEETSLKTFKNCNVSKLLTSTVYSNRK